MENYELKDRIQAVKDQQGDGTELVTLSVPPDKSLQSVRTRIEQEHASAENIKSDSTRSNVREALNRIRRVLKRYPNTPENGLVIYTGKVDGEMVEFVFDDLPRPVEESRYVCSNEFVLDPVEHIITPSNTYGLIVVERGGAALGELRGERVIPIHTFESQVMGKTKAGGQSAARFERERERQKHEFFQKVGREAQSEFMNSDDVLVDGVLLGGTTITVDDFLEGDYLDYRLRERLLGKNSIDYASEQGLQQLVDRGAQQVIEDERKEAREALDEFYSGLKEDGTVAYGEANVETALQYGAVDTLLISEALPTNEMRNLEEKVGNIGGEALIVSTDYERGEQLENVFGGMAALLRYPIE